MIGAEAGEVMAVVQTAMVADPPYPKLRDAILARHGVWLPDLFSRSRTHSRNLEAYLTAYIDGAGLAGDSKGPLFRTIGRGKGRPLTRTALQQTEAYLMIARRAGAAGIATKLGNHSFRATGITAYLKNGGTLEKATQMANHASARTIRSSTTAGARNSASTRWK